MLRNISLTFASLLMACQIGLSQDMRPWSLDECIEYAISHNIDIKKQNLSKELSTLDIEDARWSFVPSLSASTSYTMSTGRVLDPTTYDFVETKFTGNSNSSISGNVTLFEGGKKQRLLEKARLSLKASLLENDVLKHNIRINVTASYLDVLCAEEQIKTAEDIVKKMEVQLERSKIMLEAGSITESDVLQLNSQLFSAKNDVTAAINSYNLSKLTLCDLLEIKDYANFNIIFPDEELSSSPILDIESTLDAMPEFQSAEISLEIAKEDVKVAKSSLSPSLSLSAGYGTNYSDARKKAVQNPDGTIKYESYNFLQQYSDNASAFASVSLSIPILNGLSARRNLKRAEINVINEEYSLALERKELRKRLIQAQLECDSAYETYKSAEEQLKYADIVERQMSEKYNLGAVDFNAWNISVVELASAGYNLVQAKYTCMMKKKILLEYSRHTDNQ